MEHFVVNLQDIRESGKDYTFPVTRAWLKEAMADTSVEVLEDIGEGELSFFVSRSGRDLVLNGRLRSTIGVPCARCLQTAHLVVDTDFVRMLSPMATRPRSMASELELTPTDLDRDYYSGDQLVLDMNVREQLLLEIPIKPLCSEECAGISIPEHVQDSEDLDESEVAVDPRLAPLLSLVGKLGPTKE